MECYNAEVQNTKDDANDTITKVTTDINSTSGSHFPRQKGGSHGNPSYNEGETQGAGMIYNDPSLPYQVGAAPCLLLLGYVGEWTTMVGTDAEYLGKDTLIV